MRGQVPYERLLAPHVGAVEAARLARYAELLERWSARHSLVRFADRRELVERHLVDALAGVAALGNAGRLLDVGSGAGLPGVPLLVARPGWHGVLLEPRTKRWAFLRTVIRELDLAAEAVCSRYRELPPGGRWDCITARALGGYEDLLAWSWDVLSERGEVVLWTTADTEARLAALPRWRVLSSALPGLERGRLCRLQPCFT
jgi:16S rRNA (guanine527-N7)-methyltransferase